jgi:hypothetical protein
VEKFTISFFVSFLLKKRRQKYMMNLFVSYSFKKCFSHEKTKILFSSVVCVLVAGCAAIALCVSKARSRPEVGLVLLLVRQVAYHRHGPMDIAGLAPYGPNALPGSVGAVDHMPCGITRCKTHE